MKRSKKRYSRPKVKVHGSLEQLTLGAGWRGEDDQWWLFSWGSDPNTS